MSGKFVRASKYRHVFGQAAKKELQYENLRITSNAWDSNLIKTNGKFISINWNAAGGGAFAVLPIEEIGKTPDQVPLFRGHTAQVLDTDFDPFNDRRLASGSDDSKVGIWEIPEGYSIRDHVDSNGDPEDIKPVKLLSGHSRKVGHVLFHPVAENILASSSLDYTVKIWNIETGENVITLKHPDMVTSMSFSYDGNHLATVARDKKLRVWDIRKQEIVSEGPAHAGAKNQRVVWLGNSDRLATTGFSKLSDRQVGIWDAFNLEKGDLGGFYTVDQSSGILMPFYDGSNKILYLAGKGDGNIRYYEFQNDELFELSEFQSIDPQRGFAVAPKRKVNVRENEVLKCFKTVSQRIEPVSFYVPRRSEEFQDDIYPAAPSDKPALTAEQWLNGDNVDGPVLVDMRSVYEGTEPAFQDSKKETAKKETPKEQTPKKETPKEQTPKKETPKEQTPKKDTLKEQTPKKEIKEVTPEPVKKTSNSISSTPLSSSKTDLNDVLKEDSSVDKLLAKSSDLDSINDAEDPSKETSGWDEEDEKPAPPELNNKSVKSEVGAISVEVREKKEDEKETKPEPTSIATDIVNKKENNETGKKVDEKKPKSTENKADEKKTGSIEKNDATKETTSTAGATTKSMGLKQSVETLSSLVIKLEAVVEKLAASNIEKDERLSELEKKIDSLLQK